MQFIRILSNFIMFLLSPKRVRILDEEWDYLIILDACRYDFFKKYNFIKGKLERKVSMGSSTPEWFRKNFERKVDDVVYVTANPYISRWIEEGKLLQRFFYMEHLWQYEWDEELNSVHPDRVVENVLRLKEKYPDKRMIIHFLQPHTPFIGETRIPPDGRVSVERRRKAYKDNLILVLKSVKKLIDNLCGKIIVTADHGECLGEWGLWKHPDNVHVKELIVIPWLIINKGKRKIVPKSIEPPKEKKIDEGILTKRLKSLGYYPD